MNYKVMQRPMFRLGGGVIKGKKVGNRENFATITEIEDLINKRAGIRDKALSSMGSMLPLQVLAGQGDNIRTISSLGDVTNILSNLGTDPNTFAALGKLNAIDLKKTEGELSDKITLAKLKNKMAGSSTRLKAPSPAVNALPIGLGDAAGTPLCVVTVPAPGVRPVIPCPNLANLSTASNCCILFASLAASDCACLNPKSCPANPCPRPSAC